MKNAHEFAGLHSDLGINLNTLGCLMIGTESPWIDMPANVKQFEYVSPDPDKSWIKGLADDWHATVRYGFLPNVKQRHVETVVEGIEVPTALFTGGIEVFQSPFEDEPYECYVLLIEDGWLYKVNEQLSVLPNVSTYPEYRPHVTLGYFQKGKVEEFEGIFYDLIKEEVETTKWDFGRILTKE